VFDVRPNIIGIGGVIIDVVMLTHDWTWHFCYKYKRSWSIDIVTLRDFLLFTHVVNNVTFLWQLTSFIWTVGVPIILRLKIN